METPTITLEDTATGKTADLTDDVGARALLWQVLHRIHTGDDVNGEVGTTVPANATEVVAAQILSNAGSLEEACRLIEEGESLARIFESTELEAATTTKSTRSDRVAGLVDNNARDQLSGDVVDALGDSWDAFRRAVEKCHGEVKQAISIKLVFVPETEKAEAYVSIQSAPGLKSPERTRTAKVRKLKGGRYQLELF